jgi:TolB-like protein
VTVPSRGYRLVGIGSRIALHENDTEDTIGHAVPGTSIIVMPFQNLSDEKEYEYFADGMVEDLVTGLSRIKSIFVIARDSSFIYKGRSIDAEQVGRELGVRYVLAGSIRKAGDHFQVAVQLIEAQTGAHLWAESYDRPLEDIFSVQDAITMRVIGTIEPQLRTIEIARIKRKRPNNLDAYDLLLRALSIQNFMPETAAMIIPLLEKALALEPDYASAHARLALSFHIQFSRGGLHEQDRKAAIQHAHAAITSDNDDATTLAIAGLVIWLDEHDSATAFDLFDRALAISSSNVVALERAQHALRLSPFGDTSSYLALSIAYFNSKRCAEALDAALHATVSCPKFSVPYILHAISLVCLGRLEEAKAAANIVLALDPSFTMARWAATVGVVPEVFKPFADTWHKLRIAA